MIAQRPDHALSEKVNAHEEETSLSQFIEISLKFYQPRGRKGIPRGQKIDFPMNKYHASLLTLYNLSRREISQETGVSLGVIKLWHGQENFRDMILHHRNAFAHSFTESLLWTGFARPLAVFTGQPAPACEPSLDVLFANFRDFKSYSPKLLEAINARHRWCITEREAEHDLTAIAVYWALHVWSGTQMDEAYRAFLLERLRMRAKTFIDNPRNGRTRAEYVFLLSCMVTNERSA